MPAPFVSSLCGYRDGRPNTSDAGDAGSVALGKVFFDAMNIPTSADPPAEAVGNLMARLMSSDLKIAIAEGAPHLTVEPEKPFPHFEQFSYLAAARELRGDMARDVTKEIDEIEKFSSKADLDVGTREKLTRHLTKIRSEIASTESRRRELLNILGEESLLKLDIAISREMVNPITPGSPLQHLVAGFSLKWTLRTDRAQDCRSQGAKMAALRRGRMPHFAAVTMEPRPSMLALLGRGSGDVDCVYHLHLPALSMAIDDYCSGTKHKARLAIRDNFRRLRDQRRIRDYDELRSYVKTL